jgi:hypothetical protein
MKQLKESIREALQYMRLSNDFFLQELKSTSNKSKNTEMGLYQTEKILGAEHGGTHPQSQLLEKWQ